MSDTAKLEKILEIKFHNIELLIESLTHRSYLNEHPQVKNSNERLEFLGDSVLSLITSTELFQRFPDYPEGKLTALRSSLVRAKTLGLLAKKLNYGDFLLMSKGEEKSGGRANPSLLANTFESVLGAIYLDQGIGAAKIFLEKHLFIEIPKVIKDEQSFDFKSQLQVIIQEKKRISPTYKVVSQAGPDHDKTFFVAVVLGEKTLATGQGKSKQEAEQSAAHIALAQLKM